MSKATVTISIDLELAWGNWDNLREDHIIFISKTERYVIDRLLKIFDQFEIMATWAVVANLLDRGASVNLPGDEKLWYAPDIIASIANAKVAHEFGSHGGSHCYFDQITDSQARDDLEFARSIHMRNGFPFKSFVFPRNKVAKLDILESSGIKIFRGVDKAWHQRIRQKNTSIGRLANFVDKCLPLTPSPVFPEKVSELVNLPGSMLFMGRGGIRSLISDMSMELKLSKGVGAAMSTGGVFHLWFHPSNFWYKTDNQLKIFENFMSRIARLAEQGTLRVVPMNFYV